MAWSLEEEESLPVQPVPEGTAPISYQGVRGANQTWSVNEKLLFFGLPSFYAACATFSCGPLGKSSIPRLTFLWHPQTMKMQHRKARKRAILVIGAIHLNMLLTARSCLVA